MDAHGDFSRRQFIKQAGLAAGVAGLSLASLEAATPFRDDPKPDDILQQLIEGNKRFTSGKTNLNVRTPADFARDAKGQAPPAIVLGCSDSRVPPEFVFDQAVGSLFVVRVAGNLTGSGPVMKGSIEFAVAELGARLIVVMGHSACGACAAAIAHIEANDKLPGSIEGLVDYIRPVVRKVGSIADKEAKLVAVTKANAVENANRLATLDPIISDMVNAGKVKCVGAYYDLASGKVEFLG